MRFRPVKHNIGTPDFTLVLVAGALLIFGLVMLASASVVVGVRDFGDGAFFIKRQLVWLALGLVGFYITYRIDYHLWQRLALPIFLVSVVLLLAVFFPGIGISGKGAQRWLDLGVATFQPSELMKLSISIYLAALFSERGEQYTRYFRSGFLPFIGVLGIVSALVIAQPDLGSLLNITIIASVIYFLAGAHPKHLGILLVGFATFAWLAIKAAPYRLARLTAFLNPGFDPFGIGYHVQQAIIAVGSGGLLGVGLGHSRQKFLYLPEVTGDSLFAVIAEELGFVVSVGLVMLFLLFFWRGYQIAKHAPDTFGMLVAAGISVWVVGQAFMNMGAMLGVLPLTGIPLPFMSAGGSALLTVLAGLGILLNISKQTR